MTYNVSMGTLNPTIPILPCKCTQRIVHVKLSRNKKGTVFLTHGVYQTIASDTIVALPTSSVSWPDVLPT